MKTLNNIGDDLAIRINNEAKRISNNKNFLWKAFWSVTFVPDAHMWVGELRLHFDSVYTTTQLLKYMELPSYIHVYPSSQYQKGTPKIKRLKVEINACELDEVYKHEQKNHIVAKIDILLTRTKFAELPQIAHNFIFLNEKPYNESITSQTVPTNS